MGLFKPNVEKMKAQGDVEGLVKALKHKDYLVAAEAAKALGVIRDARAVEPLMQAREDKDSGVRKAAKESLEKLEAKRS